MTETETGTVEVTLVAVVLQLLQPTDRDVDAADVVLAVVTVETDEGAIEDLAKPIAELWLDEPVTHLEGLLKLPEVAPSVKVKGHLGTHGKLEGCIGGAHSGPVEGIGL